MSASKLACEVRALFDRGFSDEEISVELGCSMEEVQAIVCEYIDDMWDSYLASMAESIYFVSGDE